MSIIIHSDRKRMREAGQWYDHESSAWRSVQFRGEMHGTAARALRLLYLHALAFKPSQQPSVCIQALGEDGATASAFADAVSRACECLGRNIVSRPADADVLVAMIESGDDSAAIEAREACSGHISWRPL